MVDKTAIKGLCGRAILQQRPGGVANGDLREECSRGLEEMFLACLRSSRRLMWLEMSDGRVASWGPRAIWDFVLNPE